MLNTEHPWVMAIKEILTSVNAIHVLQNNLPVLNIKIFAKYVTDNLMQQYENTWIKQIILKPKLELYRQYKNTPSQESYCKVSLKRGQRSVLAKIRLGVFPINLELGRYSGIPREERWCAICTRQEIENEFHVFFQCPNYDSQREVLFCQATNILNIFNDLNDLEKFAFLVSNESIVRKTATFFNNILQIRQSVLRS